MTSDDVGTGAGNHPNDGPAATPSTSAAADDAVRSSRRAVALRALLIGSFPVFAIVVGVAYAAADKTIDTGPPPVTMPTDPTARAFCEELGRIQRTVSAFTASTVAGETTDDLDPKAVANLIDGFDVASFGSAQVPAEIRDDVAALLADKDEVVQALRALPPGDSLLSAIPPRVATAFASMAAYAAETCPT